MDEHLNRVRQYRERAAVTQTELAKRAGIGRVTLNRIEQGGQLPTLPVAIALADALDCTLDELFRVEADTKERS